MNQQVNQVNPDLEHLKILSILFYVLSGLCLFPMLFGVFYVVMGVFFSAAMMSADVPHRAGEPPAAIFGGFFVVFGGAFILIFLTLGLLILKAGRNLSKKQGYTFCFVVACIACLWVPFGTILGVFTIIVLSRDSVKAIFNGQSFGQFNNPPPPNWR
jgi:hypothetical protein